MSESKAAKEAGGHHDNRIPGLDGLRGLAAIGVVILHSAGLPGFPDQPWIQRLSSIVGGRSVPLFFVLSGYLITYLLLREEERSGRISLKNFYARRALRILPAALTYLLVLAVLSPWLGLNVKLKELFAAMFWYRNLLYGGWAAWALKLDGAEHFTGHYWSLSVEEHFYLVWPAVMLLMPARFRMGFLIFLLCLLPVWRAFNMKMSGIGGMNYWRTDLISDYLIAGVLLALFQARWEASPVWTRFWGSFWLAIPILAMTFFRAGIEWLTPFAGKLAASLNHIAVVAEVSLASCGLVLLVGIAVHGRQPILDCLLNSRLLIWFGAVSFSLYLWQQLFCDEHLRVLGWSFPFNAAAALAVATVSHYCVERPFLKFRGRFR